MARYVHRTAKVENSMAGGDGGSHEYKIPQLSVDDMLEIHDNVLRYFDTPATQFAQQLEAIKATGVGQPIIARWQSVLSVWMAATLHAIQPYGFPPSMEGVEKFTLMYDEVSRSESRGEELREAAKERWEVLLEKGLGMNVKDESIPLETAQSIVKLQSMKMQSEEFLNKVGESMASLEPQFAGLSEDDIKMKKQEHLLVHLLLPLQMEVYGGFGYEGDEGYVRMQAALLNHHGDEQILGNTAIATQVLFKKAGLLG